LEVQKNGESEEREGSQKPTVKEKISQIRKIPLFFVFLCVLLLDQLSKRYVLQVLDPGDIVPVIPGFFNIVLTFNPGAAFGIFGGLPETSRHIVLGLTTALALVFVIYFLIYEYYHDFIGQVALVLIMGGAAGNIVDRLLLGEVVDFLDFYFGNYHWPAFNVADSAICIGVAIIIFRRSATTRGNETRENETSKNK